MFSRVLRSLQPEPVREGLCRIPATGGQCCHSQAARSAWMGLDGGPGSAFSEQRLRTLGAEDGRGTRTLPLESLNPKSADFKVRDAEDGHLARYPLSPGFDFTRHVTSHHITLSLSFLICETRRMVVLTSEGCVMTK